MDHQEFANSAEVSAGLDETMQATKTAIARRLRYIRQQHPEGPFTMAGLAERAGISKRTLASAESVDGTNLTVETLVKVAHSLGISRVGYFLDDQVFDQVNSELEWLKKMRSQRVESVALRQSAPVGPPAGSSLNELSHLITHLVSTAEAARATLEDLPRQDLPDDTQS
ncbi:helix-turn-helix domain-containing protein [Streptomyces sp. NPDC001739]|uniref:helix-turn-helix domain-containing protein n=1 Tax=unclassified Streptomyces TaxID=2593676 RepID=UPI0004BF39C1|nr:helix-turn-helix domain-containing protein [Streptomyces sp. NRRL S-1448]